MDMARFEGPSDPGYRKVSAEIKGMLSACLQGNPYVVMVTACYMKCGIIGADIIQLALRTHAPPIVPEDVPTSAEKEIQASQYFLEQYFRHLGSTGDWIR